VVEVKLSAVGRALKQEWARLNKQVSEADPLVCPGCAGAMRIIAFIDQPAVIDLPVPRTADREDPATLSQSPGGPGLARAPGVA
jgi:hypothetical protein